MTSNSWFYSKNKPPTERKHSLSCFWKVYYAVWVGDYVILIMSLCFYQKLPDIKTCFFSRNMIMNLGMSFRKKHVSEIRPHAFSLMTSCFVWLYKEGSMVNTSCVGIEQELNTTMQEEETRAYCKERQVELG